jgi:hypothetical protein
VDERAWLRREVESAVRLTDEERIRILRDLVSTSESIRRTKSVQELLRDDEVRRLLDTSIGRKNHLAWVERAG